MAGTTLQGRSWVTAKGWRALGWPIPDDIADDEVVTPVPTLEPRSVETTAGRSWWRRRR